MGNKICPGCKTEKEETEFSPKGKYCRVCARERNRLHYADHREEIIKSNAAYANNHKDEKSIYSAAYYKEHKKELQAYSAEYNANHRSEKLEYNRAYYASRRKEIIANNTAYAEKHKNERRAYMKGYKAKRKKEDFLFFCF